MLVVTVLLGERHTRRDLPERQGVICQIVTWDVFPLDTSYKSELCCRLPHHMAAGCAVAP